jgi:hypothetical protein
MIQIFPLWMISRYQCDIIKHKLFHIWSITNWSLCDIGQGAWFLPASVSSSAKWDQASRACSALDIIIYKITSSHGKCSDKNKKIDGIEMGILFRRESDIYIENCVLKNASHLATSGRVAQMFAPRQDWMSVTEEWVRAGEVEPPGAIRPLQLGLFGRGLDPHKWSLWSRGKQFKLWSKLWGAFWGLWSWRGGTWFLIGQSHPGLDSGERAESVRISRAHQGAAIGVFLEDTS